MSVQRILWVSVATSVALAIAWRVKPLHDIVFPAVTGRSY